MKVISLVKQGEKKHEKPKLAKSLQGPERLFKLTLASIAPLTSTGKTGRRREGEFNHGASFMDHAPEGWGRRQTLPG